MSKFGMIICSLVVGPGAMRLVFECDGLMIDLLFIKAMNISGLNGTGVQETVYNLRQAKCHENNPVMQC